MKASLRISKGISKSRKQGTPRETVVLTCAGVLAREGESSSAETSTPRETLNRKVHFRGALGGRSETRSPRAIIATSFARSRNDATPEERDLAAWRVNPMVVSARRAKRKLPERDPVRNIARRGSLPNSLFEHTLAIPSPSRWVQNERDRLRTINRPVNRKCAPSGNWAVGIGLARNERRRSYQARDFSSQSTANGRELRCDFIPVTSNVESSSLHRARRSQHV